VRRPMRAGGLSPRRVRIVPVRPDSLDDARSILSRLDGGRADLDDTSDTLAKKIRTAEKDWVPYIAVIGRKEVESGKINVRVRGTTKQGEMTVDALRSRIASETKYRPFRPLAEPKFLSMRPIFRG